MKVKVIITILLAAVFGIAKAEIRLPSFITDNMVVQRNSTLLLRGNAASGSKVVVTAGWMDGTLSAKADEKGNFALEITTPEAGGPYALCVSDGRDTVILSNILSGEVWLCSGQSNMEFPVKGWTSVMDVERIVETARHPDIRLLQISKQTAYTPLADSKVNNGGWTECTPASVQPFSAVAYMYALELRNELKVPVGVIDATWGGTPAEAWTSLGGLKNVSGFEEEIAALKRTSFDPKKMQEDYDARMQRWMALAESKVKPSDKSVCGVMPTGANWENTALAPSFDGIVTLTRTIDIPAEATGKPLKLFLGALDDEDITSFNGVEIARGSGFETPREYIVPASLVKPGAADIAIRVTDFGGGGGFNGGDRMRAVFDNTEISLEGAWKYTVNLDFATMPSKPVSVMGSSYPTVLYNAMIYPLVDMPVRGVIWYQGCANVGRAGQYAPLFKQLITDWRQLWHNTEMPFYFVQLAGYLKPSSCQPESEWAALRNAQAKALELTATGMATATDLGNPDDIHPRNKQDVAHRLALIALRNQYGHDVVCEAPKLSRIKQAGKELILEFDGDIHASSVAVTGFIIAGKDGEYHVAAGRLKDKRTVVLSSLKVAKPVSVRYNWADYPNGNLYGAQELPVAPFAKD